MILPFSSTTQEYLFHQHNCHFRILGGACCILITGSVVSEGISAVITVVWVLARFCRYLFRHMKKIVVPAIPKKNDAKEAHPVSATYTSDGCRKCSNELTCFYSNRVFSLKQFLFAYLYKCTLHTYSSLSRLYSSQLLQN